MIVMYSDGNDGNYQHVYFGSNAEQAIIDYLSKLYYCFQQQNMALRSKYNQTGRKIKYNLYQNLPNYDTPQDNKFQVSFNEDGLFHNQHNLLRYDKPSTKIYQQSRQPNTLSPNQLKVYNGWNVDSKKVERNSKNNVLGEITNTYKQSLDESSAEKKHLVGSIKRNKKQSRILQNKILQDQFFEDGIDLEEIDQLSLSNLQQMNVKLNKVINKENNYECYVNKDKPNYQNIQALGYNQESLKTLKQKESLKTEFSYKKQIKQTHFEYRPAVVKHANIQTNKRQIQQEETAKAKQSAKQASYIELIFQILDSKKAGMLSKENCKIEVIPQQFKFIFGGIFTRIFLKKLTCNRREFVKLCTNSLKELNSQEVFDLIKLFIERYQERQKFFTDQNAFLQEQNLQKHGFKVNHKSANKFKSVQKQINSQYHLQFGQQCMHNHNFSQKNALPSKKSYQSQRCSVISQSKKDNPFIQKKQSLQQFDRNEGSKGENSYAKSSSKRKISISEQTIQQHKKGLQQLAELQKKMQNALKQSGNSQKFMLSGTEYLKFSQLVKHI